MSQTHETLREFYARFVTAIAGVSDARIVDAFRRVKREQFVGSGPWAVPVLGGYLSSDTDDPAVLHQDINIGLVPDKGINNGQPSLHAKCLEQAAPRAGDTVLHIGAGSGYYTAMLAHLVAPHGRVLAYEIDEGLARRATENLAAFDMVTVLNVSALVAPLPSADVVYVSAGATHVPAAWLEALRVGGRLVLPLTPNDRLGCMLFVTRLSERVYGARAFSPAGFIPCVGARDDQHSAALAAALEARSSDEVRSLHRGGEPDETAWYVWSEGWLSTAEPADGESA